VVATISVELAVPVRVDTRVALTFQGLTGLAEVALTGGAADATLVVADRGGPPTLYADPSAGADRIAPPFDRCSPQNQFKW
jgi:phospholipid/cholesterol/gamma-HCH transport system substrate-binding protein